MTSVFLLYFLTLLLCLAPLVHILARGQFRTYFVFFVTAAGFLLFNVAGSLSHNIRGGVGVPRFYLLQLMVAAGLAGLYVFLLMAAGARAGRGGMMPLESPEGAAALHTRRLFTVLAAASLGLGLAYFGGVARPLLFRVDLWGDWMGLMVERGHIVSGAPLFGWFALMFWELPTLLLVFAIVMWRLSRAAGRADAPWWRRRVILAFPVVVVFTTAYFHVLPLAYALGAAGLTVFVLRGRIPLRLVLGYGLPGLVVVVAAYVAKTGVRLERASIEYVRDLLVHRVFEVYAWGGAVVAYVFPREHPFLQGTSFVNFMGLFPYEQVNLSAFVFPYIYQGATNGGAPVPAVMEGWANFGLAGAFGILVVLLALIFWVSWLSWSPRPFPVALSIYLTTKLLLAWQVALWFGIMEPTMLLFLPTLWMLDRLLRPVTRARARVAPPRWASA